VRDFAGILEEERPAPAAGVRFSKTICITNAKELEDAALLNSDIDDVWHCLSAPILQ
jgi:hypothetical protein